MSRAAASLIIDPLGERASVAREGGAVTCLTYNGVSRLALLDHSGAELNTVKREWPELSLWAWSPNDAEYAYISRTLPADLGADLKRVADPGDCPQSLELVERAWAVEPSWWVLPVDGSPAVEVGTLEALHERWYGDRAVTFACGDEVRGGETTDGFASPRFEQPECTGGVLSELRVGGRLVGEGRRIHVLGFVEAP
jgi:hypothetical protein